MSITVFTDGACSNNGKLNALGGYGVYFPNKELPDISEEFTLHPITNQRAELYAIYTALTMIFNKCDVNKILLYSDSDYSIKCLTSWIYNWKRNNWKTSNKKPVKNKDIIENISKLIDQNSNVTVSFFHVKAHTNKTDDISMGNHFADKLATNGINNNPSIC